MMIEHLREMSNMIRQLKDAGHVLIDEQQVQAVIRSLPDSWVRMKQILTHNEDIKNFSDASRHVELEADCQVANHSSAALINRSGKYQTIGSRHAGKVKPNKQGGATGPKKRITKRQRGKRGGKKDMSKVKCYNCGNKGHFACDCTEPKKVSFSPNPLHTLVCSRILVAHSHPNWFVDT